MDAQVCIEPGKLNQFISCWEGRVPHISSEIWGTRHDLNG